MADPSVAAASEPFLSASSGLRLASGWTAESVAVTLKTTCSSATSLEAVGSNATVVPMDASITSAWFSSVAPSVPDHAPWFSTTLSEPSDGQEA